MEKLKRFSEGESCIKCGSTDKKVFFGIIHPNTERCLEVKCRCGYTYFRSCLDSKDNIDR